MKERLKGEKMPYNLKVRVVTTILALVISSVFVATIVTTQPQKTKDAIVLMGFYAMLLIVTLAWGLWDYYKTKRVRGEGNGRRRGIS